MVAFVSLLLSLMEEELHNQGSFESCPYHERVWSFRCFLATN